MKLLQSKRQVLLSSKWHPLFVYRLYSLCNWRIKELAMWNRVTWLIICLAQVLFCYLCPLIYRWKQHRPLRNFSVICRVIYRESYSTPGPKKVLAFLGMKLLSFSDFLVTYSKGTSPEEIFIFKLGLFWIFDCTSRHHNPNKAM